jgi:hypothetical protein
MLLAPREHACPASLLVAPPHVRWRARPQLLNLRRLRPPAMARWCLDADGDRRTDGPTARGIDMLMDRKTERQEASQTDIRFSRGTRRGSPGSGQAGRQTDRPTEESPVAPGAAVRVADTAHGHCAPQRPSHLAAGSVTHTPAAKADRRARLGSPGHGPENLGATASPSSVTPSPCRERGSCACNAMALQSSPHAVCVVCAGVPGCGVDAPCHTEGWSVKV